MIFKVGTVLQIFFFLVKYYWQIYFNHLWLYLRLTTVNMLVYSIGNNWQYICPAKNNIKHSWYWLFMLAAVCQILSVNEFNDWKRKLCEFAETCWEEKSWNHFKLTNFWRIWAIWNHCGPPYFSLIQWRHLYNPP